ncbi:MAG TPA: hypothetical protein VF614_12315 [Chthoniobacteraceae bacterium]|jgi:hypothetical protein
MSTITAVLEPHGDGTLHLPLPDHLLTGKVKIVATLERAEDSHRALGTPLQALRELRKLTPFHGISDPIAWQRNERAERPLSERR